MVGEMRNDYLSEKAVVPSDEDIRLINDKFLVQLDDLAELNIVGQEECNIKAKKEEVLSRITEKCSTYLK